VTPAGFVGFASPALLEGHPSARGAADPIPQYCDLALGRPGAKRWTAMAAGRLLPPMAPAALPRPRVSTGLLRQPPGAIALGGKRSAIAPPGPLAGASVRLPRLPASPEAPWIAGAAPWIAGDMKERGRATPPPAPTRRMPSETPGFEIDPPQAATGADSPRSRGPKEFRLYPVWLAALFALSDPRLCARAASSSDEVSSLRPRDDCRQPELAAGPGFSGLLEWPRPGAVYWEFRETWSPTGVIQSVPEAIALNITSARKPWEAALNYWRAAPALARGVVMALPLLVPAIIYAPMLYSPGAHSAGAPSRWDSFLSAVHARASVDIRDGFASGFNAWTGADSTWSSDSSGSARPGRLALLRESIPMTNYRLEFLGQIESKALSVALRASDLRNYQAAKLVVVKPGPLPSLAFVHYPVINGVEGPRTQTPPLTMEVRADTLYKVQMDVEGDHFLVTVNGQFVAAWSDGRLKSGGVGFFTEKGEQARLIGVHVIDNEDFLGRLCYQVSQWTADRRRIGAKDE
jgi:hypothetical protein